MALRSFSGRPINIYSEWLAAFRRIAENFFIARWRISQSHRDASVLKRGGTAEILPEAVVVARLRRRFVTIAGLLKVRMASRSPLLELADRVDAARARIVILQL